MQLSLGRRRRRQSSAYIGSEQEGLNQQSGGDVTRTPKK